jgi:hypothetical protein
MPDFNLVCTMEQSLLSSFAAAAAIGGMGGLAQIGNNGSVLTADTQIRKTVELDP